MNNHTINPRTLGALLDSGDPHVVLDAIAAVLELDDPSVTNELLEATSWTPHAIRHGIAFDDEAQRLTHNGAWPLPPQTRHIAEATRLRILAKSADRSHVRAVAINTGDNQHPPLPVDDLSWSAGFENLSHVYLFGTNVTDAQLASLAHVPLTRISVINHGRPVHVPGHATITSLAGIGIAFQPDGHWPELTSVGLGTHGDLDPLLDGSPALTDLVVDTSPTNHISGIAHKMRDLAIIRSSSLQRARLHGAHFVQHAPNLRELELDGRAAVTGTPKLETLRLGEVTFELGTELDRLTRETGATVEQLPETTRAQRRTQVPA